MKKDFEEFTPFVLDGGVFPKLDHTPKKRYTAKAEKNASTFVYVPPTYKRASPIIKTTRYDFDWDCKQLRPVQTKKSSSPKRRAYQISRY